MAIAVIQSGIFTPTNLGTETTLATILIQGEYQLIVDTNNMGMGDQFIASVFLVPYVGATERLAYTSTILLNQPSIPLVISPPFVSPVSWRATVNQIFGTPRAFPWAVWQTQ